MDEEKHKVNGGWAAKTYFASMFQLYKINRQDWLALWDRQGGCCGGCKRELAHPEIFSKDKRLKPEVDHDHKTAVTREGWQRQDVKKEDVRGLLCRRCNDFLGRLNDNRSNLQGMLEYLDQHEERYARSKQAREQAGRNKGATYPPQGAARDDTGGTGEGVQG